MEKKATIRDVAAHAEVSIASVSLYLNNKPGLSEATRQKIGEAIDKLDYVRQRKPAVSQDASLINLLVERLPFSVFSDMFYGEVIHGMEARARELGYSLTLTIADQLDTGGDLLNERLRGVVGLIILGAGDLSEDVIGSVLDYDLPVLFVDAQLPTVVTDCVLVDNIGGAHRMVQYLLQKSYKRIACIKGPEKYPSLVERFHGYCTALIDAGKPLEPALIQASLSHQLPNKGYLEMNALLDSGADFDAVFCVSDRTAFGAFQALQERGMRVPDDIALAGFDNVAQASYTNPPLTTVHVPKVTMGALAIERLHNQVNGNISQEAIKSVLYTSLVVRQSA